NAVALLTPVVVPLRNVGALLQPDSLFRVRVVDVLLQPGVALLRLRESAPGPRRASQPLLRLSCELRRPPVADVQLHPQLSTRLPAQGVAAVLLLSGVHQPHVLDSPPVDVAALPVQLSVVTAPRPNAEYPPRYVGELHRAFGIAPLPVDALRLPRFDERVRLACELLLRLSA